MTHLLKFHGHQIFGNAPAAKDLTINVTLPLTLNNPTLQVRFHRTIRMVCIPLCIPPWCAPPADWFFERELVSCKSKSALYVIHSFIGPDCVFCNVSAQHETCEREKESPLPSSCVSWGNMLPRSMVKIKECRECVFSICPPLYFRLPFSPGFQLLSPFTSH